MSLASDYAKNGVPGPAVAIRPYVRFGSKSDIPGKPAHSRSTPESGHRRSRGAHVVPIPDLGLSPKSRPSDRSAWRDLVKFCEGWIAGVATYQAEPYPRPVETRVEHDGAWRDLRVGRKACRAIGARVASGSATARLHHHQGHDRNHELDGAGDLNDALRARHSRDQRRVELRSISSTFFRSATGMTQCLF